MYVVSILILIVVASLIGLFIWIYRVQKEVPEVLKRVGQALILLWCYVLIYFWRVKFEAKKSVPWIVFAIFVLFGVFSFVEIVGHLIHAAPHSWLDNKLEWIFGNIIIQVIALLIEALVVVHHFMEHKKRNREATMCAVLSQLLGPLNTVNLALSQEKDTVARIGARRVFETQFSQAFVRLFQERGIDGTSLSIMRWDSVEEKLKIEFPFSEPSDINLKLELPAGVGAAGKSFANNTMIYFPSISYRHGIEILPEQLNVLPSLYVEISPQPFLTVLCIPILGADKAPVGVLNFTSSQSNAFSPSEFRMATLAATIISLMV